MEDRFILYLDRLKGGQKALLDGSYSPGFLQISEEDLLFKTPVEVRGEAYISGEHLVIHFSEKSKALMPCRICNEMTEVVLTVAAGYHTLSLPTYGQNTFSFADILREALLLELPKFVECHNGHCPQRAVIEPYLHKQEKKKDDETHYPFSELEKLF